MVDFKRQHEYLVGIDSDGCAFDTMELKHKKCFIPNTISYYELQGVSQYVREAAEFVNLYSKSRGINRFPALIEALAWVRRRPEVKARGVKVRIPQAVVAWIRRETKLGNPALKKAAEATGDPELKQALAWSEAVNRAADAVVRAVPPFPSVRENLLKLGPKADILVVSVAPQEALHRQWEEHDLAGHVGAIAGQESGTKTELLKTASLYGPCRALMIGDAPSDYDAAKANHALFFPINPGDEEASWRRFYEEGIERFFAGTFAGSYQDSLLAEFDRCLPERPPWAVEE